MMGLWIFRIFEHYFGYDDSEITKMRKELREDAEKNYGLNTE